MSLTARPPSMMDMLFERHGGSVRFLSIAPDDLACAEEPHGEHAGMQPGQLPVVEDSVYRREQRKAARTQERIKGKWKRK